MANILVTGAAGFIGFHLSQHLLTRGDWVIGLDNLNDYYDVSLKQDRLNQLCQHTAFKFCKLDLADREGMAQLFTDEGFDVVVNLAAQAGVRYSLENPHVYVDSNLVGFVNILEGCRHSQVKHLVFASSSSVYGANTRMPFSVRDNVDHPVSLYAASKKANELMAHTYSHLYGLPATGLRFFTVYGPWGRPDMALFLFTRAILAGQPIDVFVNILEGCRHSQVKHLVFASSSSVYGANTRMPFSVRDNVDHPVSLYAASKKANELMAHTYSHLYGLPATGLRFFTVYGPWGRPDMALFLFTRAILAGQPIDVFNYGKMKRDFTYIDDIIEGVVRVVDTIPRPDPDWSGDAPTPGTSSAPYRLYNIGNNQPVELMYFIEVLEACLGRKAEKNMLPLQPGDVLMTYADVDALVQDVGFKPNTSIEVGIERFVEWYRNYYSV